MKHYLVFIFAFCLHGCATLPATSSSASDLVCEIYTNISAIDFDKTSSEDLRAWVSDKFPNAQIEDYSQTEPYDYTLEWEHNQIEYFANYKDGEILNIQVIITKQEISPQNVFECLGVPRYYGASAVLSQLSIGLIYPEKGVNVVGLFRESLDLPSINQPIIKIMNFARPTTNLNEFLIDVSPFGNTNDATINVHPWEGWEAIEMFGL